MQKRPHSPETIAVHIRAAARPEAESARLLRDLLNYSWPGGQSDRTEPLAQGWLAVWGPNPTVVRLAPCECKHGHCTICN
jgi:hypothetical protein